MGVMETMTGDVLDINNIYRSYVDYKRALDGELQRSAESFVRIGYLLKVARDTDILQESAYRSVNDFAQAEYGLDKSQVSRFIRINDEFADGYSDRLQERYQSFGYAKLSLMLLLPAAIREELTADLSKAEIQAVKEEIDEEKKVTDLEVMMEEKNERQQETTIFGKVLYQIGKDDPEFYVRLWDAVMAPESDGKNTYVIDRVIDVLAPSDIAIISVRIPGEGRKMLSIKGADSDPVIVDVRSGERRSCTWDCLIIEMERLCEGETVRESWERLYGEPFPEKKAGVAPVQPGKQQEARKTSRVIKAKKPEKTREETEQEGSEKAMPEAGQKAEEDKGQEAADSGTEEERKAQTQVTTDDSDKQAGGHTAATEPGNNKTGVDGGTGEDGAGSGEDRESREGEPDAGIENALTDADGMRRHIENQTALLIAELNRMKKNCEYHCWDSLIEKARGIIVRVESIKNMEAMLNE